MKDSHMRRPHYYHTIAITICIAIVLQPFLFTLQLLQPTMARGQFTGEDIFLPAIQGPPGEPGAEPNFVITSPREGSMVGGTFFFSIQPLVAESITSVTFKHGETVLGTDSKGSDGFRIFVDAADLPDGAVELTATATGPQGSVTEKTEFTLVADPTASATIMGQGAVLQSEIGSTISILPGTAPEGTTVTIDELTQEETAARHGIDWESMGGDLFGRTGCAIHRAAEWPIWVGLLGRLWQPRAARTSRGQLPYSARCGRGWRR
jgi:hypothetical protein